MSQAAVIGTARCSSWMGRGVLVLAALLAVSSHCVAQAADAAQGLSREATEEIIRDYLLKNPEVIEQALGILEERQRQAARQQSLKAVTAHQEELLGDPGSPIGGNPRGSVTVVEFFDYRCPHCKHVAPEVKRLAQEDRDVRIVYKQLPVLGPESDLAARAGLAAAAQGKHAALHEALIAADGPLTLRAILQLAGPAGLDLARLQADMEAPAIRATIERDRALAAALGITGTPTFVVGSELVPGEVDLAALKALVSETRAKAVPPSR
jgi:protein-disulfide isomerase